jgi:hypothetical protein
LQCLKVCEENPAWRGRATGAWTDALPATPMAAVFKDVQDRAMEIAMENAESVLTFAGKISNAQTFQDISAFQTQFVQERIQAFVTQTQELSEKRS